MKICTTFKAENGHLFTTSVISWFSVVSGISLEYEEMFLKCSRIVNTFSIIRHYTYNIS